MNSLGPRANDKFPSLRHLRVAERQLSTSLDQHTNARPPARPQPSQLLSALFAIHVDGNNQSQRNAHTYLRAIDTSVITYPHDR